MSVSILLRRVALEAAFARVPAGDTDWMTEAEHSRAAAMRSMQRRSQFVAGHWLAREMAVAQAGGDPGQWRWCRDEGAPAKLLRESSCLFVSISHSGDQLACALGSAPVGVDIETATKARDLLAMAQQAFSPAENATLQDISGEALAERFYLYWTIKEAWGKRAGTGLHLAEARRCFPMSVEECAAAEVDTWSSSGMTIALAHEASATVDVAGMPDGMRHACWRIDTLD